MADVALCGSCKQTVSLLFAAQFCNGPAERRVICRDCWRRGERCFVGPRGLATAKGPPSPEHRHAVLYWDENDYVTDGSLPTAYPSTEQPETADTKGEEA